MTLTPETKRIKTRWLKALRSGKYKQGHNVMYDPKQKSFCCLGVLEHCLLNGKVEDEWDLTHNDFDAEDNIVHQFATLPSVKFYKTYNLSWIKENAWFLAQLNDEGTVVDVGDNVYSGAYSFEQIACYIEDNWK